MGVAAAAVVLVSSVSRVSLPDVHDDEERGLPGLRLPRDLSKDAEKTTLAGEATFELVLLLFFVGNDDVEKVAGGSGLLDGATRRSLLVTVVGGLLLLLVLLPIVAATFVSPNGACRLLSTGGADVDFCLFRLEQASARRMVGHTWTAVPISCKYTVNKSWGRTTEIACFEAYNDVFVCG